MRPLTRLLFLLLCLTPKLWADTTAGAPPGQSILVITGSAGFGTFPSFQNFIQQSGAGGQWNYCTADMNGGTGFITEMQTHTVTVQSTVPALAVLQTYDQVWDMRFANDTGGCTGCCTAGGCGLNQITPAQQADYLTYIATGGSLMLLGDNGGFPFRNNPIIAIAQAVDNAGTWATGGIFTNNDATHQGAYINVAGAAAAENFATDYRNLTGANNWIAAQYNGMVANWGSGYKVLEDFATGNAVATAWDCANMDSAYTSGKLFIVLDWQIMGGDHQVNYCGPAVLSGTSNGFNERFWENMVDYLVPSNACSTPTFTSTRTSTSTRTATPTFSSTRTSTPVATFTSTSTVTPSSSDTATSSSTRTSTSTSSETPSRTVTPSHTQTRTPSHTATESNTVGPSPTFTSTRTVTPSSTSTPTPSHTASSTATRTETPSSTTTPSRTATGTQTSTVTETSLYTATNTPTSSATPSITASRTVTPSNTDTRTGTVTSSPSPSSTETASRTATPTVTETRTSTATATASVSYTTSPTRSPSWTASATPIPVPHHVKLSVYNSAGELVKLLFEGGAQYQPGQLQVDKDVVPGGSGNLTINFPGYLWDPAQGGVITGISWGANNDSGQLVRGGVYYIKADIVDQFGQTTTLQRSVQVVDVAPQNTLNIYNGAGELVTVLALPSSGTGRFAGLRLPSDSYGVKYDETNGSVSSGLFTMIVMDEQGQEYPLYWDGRNSQGVPVSSGSYTAELVYTAPGSGGRRVVQSKGLVVIQAGNSASLAGSYAAPNPSMRGADIIVHYPLSLQYATVARLYSLSGELVAQSDDRGYAGKLRFGTQGLASGVYAIKIEKLSGSAVAARTVVKVAVVR